MPRVNVGNSAVGTRADGAGDVEGDVEDVEDVEGDEDGDGDPATG
jgi:hypothetical protein